MKRAITICVFLFILAQAAVALAQPGLPAAFKDLPQYPGATVLQTVDSGGTVTVMFEASASLDQIVAFFNKELPQRGWSKTMEARQNEGAMVSYANGQKSLTIGVGPGEGGSNAFSMILAGH